MKRRYGFLAVALPLVGAVVVIVWVSGVWRWWFAPRLTWAVEAPASEGRLIVAANVHVSASRPDAQHYGCTIAADPEQPDHLFAASNPCSKDGLFEIVGYYSCDCGQHWQLGCERLPRLPDERCCDEAVAFGPGGNLVLAHMRGDFGNEMVGVKHARVDFVRSSDGGITWTQQSVIDHWVDRPQLAFDLTQSSTRGRLYCNANDVQRTSKLNFNDARVAYRSTAAVYAAQDAGAVLNASTIPDRELLTGHNSNPVVLSDGAVVAAYHRSVQSATTPNRITVWRSTDGGRSLAEVASVPTRWRHSSAHAQGFVQSFYPRLAAAHAGGATAGALYCVWDDGPLICFSSSADRGDSWSAPIVLSEQAEFAPPDGRYYAGMPAIAVNNRGVIAIAWYDRRNLPAKRIDAAGVIREPGYDLRLRASTDGGRTWIASTQINQKSGKGEPIETRFWGVGMAADAQDRFHPAWVSDCDGTQQIWTSTVMLEPGR